MLVRLAKVRGSKTGHAVTGDYNCGCPTLAECAGLRGAKRGTSLPLQTKRITNTITERLVELSEGTPFTMSMKEAARFLRDASRYSSVPDPELWRSSCNLSAEQVRHQIDIGFWVLLTDAETKEIRGICKVFTKDEDWKEPPRARVITWTWSVNQDLGTRPPFDLFNQGEVRHLVWEGSHAASVDGKAAFNQFLLEGEVPMLHCVNTELGWCKITRSAMGGRPSCFISDTALRVIAAKSISTWKTYVDNLLLVGIPDVLREDLGVVRDRAEYADYTFNEDMSDIDALIKTRLEFLGVILDFAKKTVCLAPKVLAKLASVWARRANWLMEDFIICMCVLVYTANVLGRQMSKWQTALQVWARAQGDCMAEPEMKKAFLESLPAGCESQLRDWVELTLLNVDLEVPSAADKKHDFMLITDASVRAWCGIILSLKTGQSTVVRGDWPEGYYDLLKHSTTAEPMAVAASVNTFFEPYAGARVLHVGDNTATVREINKGYSTREGRFLAQYLATEFPYLTLDSDYYPGELIPADGPSRQEAFDKEKLEVLAARYSVSLGKVREVKL
jgi:hypothetical protein